MDLILERKICLIDTVLKKRSMMPKNLEEFLLIFIKLHQKSNEPLPNFHQLPSQPLMAL